MKVLLLGIIKKNQPNNEKLNLGVVDASQAVATEGRRPS